MDRKVKTASGRQKVRGNGINAPSCSTSASPVIGGDRRGAYYSPYRAETTLVTETPGEACPGSIMLPGVSYQSTSSMPWFVLRQQGSSDLLVKVRAVSPGRPHKAADS
jgi:hypothetical protein